MIKNTAFGLLIIYFIILLSGDYSCFAIDTAQLPPIEAKDNGSHIFEDPNYHEWWYFDGTSDSGYNFCISFLIKAKYNQLNYYCGLRMLTPDGKVISSKQIFDAGEVEIAKDRHQVKMGNNYIYYEDNKYVIHFESIDISMHMDLKPMVEGFGDKKIVTDRIKNKGSFCIVSVPKGKLSGKMKIKGRDIFFNGLGYHDHTWGAGFFDRETGYPIDKWFWGRIFTDNFTIIFVDNFSSNDIRSTFVFLADNNGNRMFFSDASIEYSNNIMDGTIKYPKNTKINLNNYGQVKLVLKKTFIVVESYCKWVSNAIVELTIDNKRRKEYGTAVCEFAIPDLLF